ncbi:SCP-like protein [Oesophagostomum dentatum]|uniref:SCP-like protein n=1 Tax=Oesophagostomum dentatum TaxID=61180 RepID=A0A0B1TL82_OESDE|nr:SCP-like protein [Oesophagostomum dentatum]
MSLSRELTGASFQQKAKTGSSKVEETKVPKKGEPLYLAKPGSNQGCTDDSTCKDVVKADGQCEVAKGLCTTSADTIDAATTSAPSQLPTLPTQPTPTTPPTAVITIPATATNDVMTQAIRDKIVYMHNWHRSEVAQGRVRNGKDGKDNFKEASDMYKMSYDMSLEADAQIRAKTCSSGFSDRSHRSSGENVYVNSSTTMPYLQVVSEGMEYWRGEVDSNGMNYRMQFIKNLETKPNSPLDYIQMVWASSYKVGCGVARCPFGTVFVCRYYPRGRIRDHYIYHTGGLCESCKDGCSKGLCPAP